MTQNAGDPSVSGGFDLEDDSGFYFGAWAANVLASDGTDSGSLELDGYLGYSGSFNDNAGYDVGYIAYTYPDVDSWDFEEVYISFDFYGVYVMYAAGEGTANNYGEIGYSVDAGPGSFSISYGDYENTGTNYLVGYDWTVGDFTLGFYYMILIMKQIQHLTKMVVISLLVTNLIPPSCLLGGTKKTDL